MNLLFFWANRLLRGMSWFLKAATSQIPDLNSVRPSHYLASTENQEYATPELSFGKEGYTSCPAYRPVSKEKKIGRRQRVMNRSAVRFRNVVGIANLLLPNDLLRAAH